MRPGRIALGVAGAVAATGLAGFLVLRPDRELSTPLLAPGTRPVGLPTGETGTVTTHLGTSLAVEAFGPVGAPQVVLSHGWANTSRVWDDVVALVADELRVVVWDQPGHGASEPPPGRAYSLDVLGDALRAVLDQAATPGPVVLGGHSMGGMSTLNLLRRDPSLLHGRVNGLLLASTMSRVPVQLDVAVPALEALSGAARWALDNGGRALARVGYERAASLTRAVTRRVALGSDATAEQVDRVARLFATSDPDVLAGLTLPILSLDEEEQLHGLRVPTVVVTGEHDLLTPPAYGWHLSHRLPDAELVLLPGVGHMTPLESPHVVADHLRRLAAGPGGVA